MDTFRDKWRGGCMHFEINFSLKKVPNFPLLSNPVDMIRVGISKFNSFPGVIICGSQDYLILYSFIKSYSLESVKYI